MRVSEGHYFLCRQSTLMKGSDFKPTPAASASLLTLWSPLKAHWFLLLKMSFAIWANVSPSPTNNDCEWNYFWKCGCIVTSESWKVLPPQSSAVFPLTSRNPFWPPRSSAADTPGRPLSSSARPTPPEIKAKTFRFWSFMIFVSSRFQLHIFNAKP